MEPRTPPACLRVAGLGSGARNSSSVSQAASLRRSRPPEEAFDDAFEAGRALGEGLHVLAEVRDVGLDFDQVSADFLPEDLDVGAQFLRRL